MPTVTSFPVSSYYSTHLNPRVQTFEALSTRIAQTLGYPKIKIEAHQNQVFDNIALAIEMFTKYAGYDEHYLVFNSELYEKGKGIKVDTMMTLTPRLSKPQYNVPKDSEAYRIGNMIIGETGPGDFIVAGDDDSDTIEIPRGFDDLLLDYRRVIDVFAFEEGTSSGINTLFTIEQTLAQQTYFSYAMGNFGFDLVSWYILKDWLDVREKILSQKQYFNFDAATQRLHLIPEPRTVSTNYYGAVGCYVEKPIRELVKEPWVYKYALALTKVNIANVRGKYAGTQLFGQGTMNYQDLMQQGITEMGMLEEALYTGAPGLGDAAPPMFFVG